jgi:hypothetical protein
MLSILLLLHWTRWYQVQEITIGEAGSTEDDFVEAVMALVGQLPRAASHWFTSSSSIGCLNM